MTKARAGRPGPLLLAVLGPLAWFGCTENPVSVDETPLLAKKGGGGEIAVTAADPETAPQGTVGLDVRILGSGFEPGSQASFLLDGKGTPQVKTNSTTFVSSTELIANIDVAADATADLYDIQVQASRGRKGIGIELFSVTVTPQACQVDFDLQLDDTNPVRSDDGTVYSHGTDRVAVFTGSGPGLRFDTNGSQKLEARNDRRRAVLDFSGTGLPDLPGPNDRKGIDMRFGGAGLNLCDMAIGTTGTVPLDLAFLDMNGDQRGLKYGGATHTGEVCATPEVSVTRTGQGTWDVVSGASACVVKDGSIQVASVAMPVAYSLTAQGAVP